mmetsp:Transcript_15346/g.33854  ORF Transcript_15346/g.33854 Transcript_15346/m.33854 type:complete len:155 (-) Transcript_15346:176-640(-)|eukprot:CAMPEP_0173194180 /NCGR_PEP_ID=MMETSP1141-20130122/14367_1 /TAXON_ID=483371 /ORGANISM="non described non described, Strain CCMP2298" /LENGTH=154 /DNA_ID=CAMNT_0014118591 /DNA_START=101 /DNA_END=565 /DNA_ORIENTATION=+
MNKAFQAVVATYKPTPTLTHVQDVMRLYRGCLRNLTSWCESRDVFNFEADKVRAQFNANMTVTEPAKITRLVREAKDALKAQTHADPYIASYMPGGTLFMRNPPMPVEALYPDGLPEGTSRRRLNIDMSNVPDDQPYADKVFVDSANKLYWIDK